MLFLQRSVFCNSARVSIFPMNTKTNAQIPEKITNFSFFPYLKHNFNANFIKSCILTTLNLIHIISSE